MSRSVIWRRRLSLLFVVSLLLASVPQHISAQEQGDGHAGDNRVFLPLVGSAAPLAPPENPPDTRPPAVPLAPYGDNGEWPVQLAGATGAVQPSLHGPQRNLPEEGIPEHAYSPFDERNNREHPCPPGGCDVIPGELLLKLAPSAPVAGAEAGANLLRSAGAELNAALDQLGVANIEPVFPAAIAPQPGALIVSAEGDLLPEPDLTRWVRLTLVNADTDLAAAAASLGNLAQIDWVEPVYVRRPVGEMGEQPEPASRDQAAISAPASAPAAEALTFDDPLYAQQWHLGATNVPAAWQWLADRNLPPGGSRDIVVAVIDTGVDYTHPDLAANIWTNSREIPGNGQDDDGNGYVDDVRGVDTVTNDGDPQDDHGHGTHVAGIIAAQANNGIGGAGVAYNVQIMPIKAAQYSGVLASADIAEAIYYAAAQGADVINMSFGGYARSQVEEDALAVAFGQAVLVAAAGNDGKPNQPCPLGRDMYPAAYNWVLGVMASVADGGKAGFSNYDCQPRDSHEYELKAPGVDVWSTLPQAQYAAWDGTSMAAPVVSGIAALARTRWSNKDTYSSRFIMGQIAANAQGGAGGVADALTSLTVAPNPKLSYLEHWTFDTTAQAAGNDGDGIVDAGETVDLAIMVRNHWGKADQVAVKLEPRAAGAVQPDPYVTMQIDSVDYGAVGSFNTDDNGLIYEDGVITGVRNPFRFTVAADTPNDHLIPFRLTMTAVNGYNPTAPALTFTSSFYLLVQRGRELPRIILEDTVLTNDYYWIVPAQTLLSAGVTVTVTQGTQVQWGVPAPNDPHNLVSNAYLQVEGTLLALGTLEDTVQFFPAKLQERLQGNVSIQTSGITDLQYVMIWNPHVGTGTYNQATSIDHGYFNGDSSGSISSVYLTRSIIDKIRAMAHDVQSQHIQTSLLDSLAIGMGYYGTASIQDTVFLLNSKYGTVSLTLKSATYTEAEAVTTTPHVRNAFLSSYWDSNIQHRMHVIPYYYYGRDVYMGIAYNYWGTTSATLIDSVIHDFNDDFNVAHVAYQPFLTIPATTTYPFVIDTVLATSSQSGASALDGPPIVVGAEPVTFTVTFNRDMDPAVQPAVSFGPDVLFTDYTTHAVAGGWADDRTWQGVFEVSPVTGDGYQYIRVAGARAADDPWLVTGDDSERFRFEIITSGTEAMNLQATGGEGLVDLSWTQDDFDLLAGYNVYRSDSAGGSYARINSTIIPPDQRVFRDPNVTPGVTYYYKFTVVKSDMTESDFSNMASAAPLDTIAPTISHTPVTSAEPGLALTLAADVTDNVAVQGVTLFFRRHGTATYTARAMIRTTGGRYSATVEGSRLASPGLDYYIEASDGLSVARSGSAAAPWVATIQDRPVVTTIAPSQGPASGGTTVTIRGSNFKSGATAAVGGVACASPRILSSTEIECTTGSHVPGLADVRVTNSNGQYGQLLNGYTYVADAASIALPSAAGGQGMTVVIPVNIANVTSLAAAELTVTFDPAVLRSTAVRTGGLTSGWSVASNGASPGQVMLALASAGTPASGAGVLANLEFEVLGGAGVTSTLGIAGVSLNDGAIPAQVSAGLFTVEQQYSIAGMVRAWKAAAAVPNVAMGLSGDRALAADTGADGAYLVQGLPQGSYTLTPQKPGDANGISAYDAALVLQHTVGLNPLSGDAFTAGDVNADGNVTAMDAFYILQKAVDLIPLPFPGAGVAWKFTPESRTYDNLAENRSGQDFTAILLGDVSGNWSTPTLAAAGAPPNESAGVRLGEPVMSEGETRVPVLINAAGAGVNSLELAVHYSTEGATVTVLEPVLLDAAEGWLLASNLDKPGVVRLVAAGAGALQGAAPILELRFTGLDAASALEIEIVQAVADELPLRLTTPAKGSSIYLPVIEQH